MARFCQTRLPIRCERSRGMAAHLRLLYEAHPMAFRLEQAGDPATDGRQRILWVSRQARCISRSRCCSAARKKSSTYASGTRPERALRSTATRLGRPSGADAMDPEQGKVRIGANRANGQSGQLRGGVAPYLVDSIRR